MSFADQQMEEMTVVTLAESHQFRCHVFANCKNKSRVKILQEI